ncbi:MAG: alpha/beta fold hydrolase [Anaerolineae bacterium]
MTVPRFLGNLVLAVLLICVIAALFAAGLGVALAGVWENAALGADDGLDWAWLGEEPIHYTQVGPGDGAPVVLIHGYAPEGADAWSADLPALAEANLRVIAVDLRGFGYSSRDTTAGVDTKAQAKLVADLLDTLGIEQATIVGHDWGCAVALQLALDQPARVQRLALIAPVLEPSPVSRWRPLLKTAPLGRALVLATTCAGPYWESTRTAGYHDATLVTAAYLESVQQPARAQGSLEAMRLAALGSEGVDLKAFAGQNAPPTLIVRGSDDAQVSERVVENLAGQLAGAEVVVIEEAGHWPQQEQAISVVNTLVAWCSAGS